MEHLFKLFISLVKQFFRFTIRSGQKLLDLSNRLDNSKYLKPISIGAIIIMFIAVYFHLPICISIIMIFILLLIEFISDIKKCLLSIVGFLGIGLLYWSIFTFLIISFITTEVNSSLNIIYSYVIVILTWCFYSLLANNKVANTANQLLSALFAIIVVLKDTIISILPDFILSEEIVEGYTVEKIFEMMFNFTFTPILIINIIAMALCALKGYWIEKYNYNQDIEEA